MTERPSFSRPLLSRRKFLTAGASGAMAFVAPFAFGADAKAPATSDQSTIKALAFDVGGTVFDWHSTVRDEIDALAHTKGLDLNGAEFANRWRRGMFGELGRVIRGQSEWMNIDALHRIVLDRLLDQYSIQSLSEQEKRDLNQVWHRIKPWPDVRSGLQRLRTRYIVFGFSILSFRLLVDVSKRAGLHWDALISCEFLKYYKPDPRAYQGAVALLGMKPEEVMMVAAHPMDLRGALSAGLKSAYVPRPAEYGTPDNRDLTPDPNFEIVAKDFNNLADKLI